MVGAGVATELFQTGDWVWEVLLTDDAVLVNNRADIDGFLPVDHLTIFEFSKPQAEDAGLSAFELLKNKYKVNLTQEKVDYSFDKREKAIERIGLQEVKSHRLNKFKQQKEQCQLDYAERQMVKPELNALSILRAKLSPMVGGGL